MCLGAFIDGGSNEFGGGVADQNEDEIVGDFGMIPAYVENDGIGRNRCDITGACHPNLASLFSSFQRVSMARICQLKFMTSITERDAIAAGAGKT